MKLVAILLAACGRLDFADRAHDGAIAGKPDGPAPAGDAVLGGDANADGCLSTYLICDGFEGSAFQPVWSTCGATLDNTVAHRGSQSVHVHTDTISANDGDNEGLEEKATFANATEPLFVRAFVRFGSIPVNHMAVVYAVQVDTSPNTDGVFETSDGLVVYSQFSDTSDQTMLQPTLEAWTCIVFEIVRATDQSGKLVLSGDFAGQLDAVPTDGTPPLGALELGIGFAASTDTQTEPAYDLWIDDVIVANTPLTCAD